MRFSLAVGVCGLLLIATQAVAHHSFAAEYDSSKPITLTGVVTKIDWSNPHVYIYLAVTGEDGRVVNWALEGHPPNTLRRTGWHQASLKENDAITVTGWRSKDGTNRIAGREVTLPDGKKLFLGPPAAQ
jgi:WD40 repeat protein